jgi:hypothetical protein
LLQEFRMISNILQALDKHHPQCQERRRELLGELLDINQESQPLAEAKDILDEIKIIQTTLEEQVAVVDSSEMKQITDLWANKTGPPFEKARAILQGTKKSFAILKARAEEIQSSVS